MSKFRYYLVSVMNGEVTGTDNREAAESMAESEDDFVIDTETGEWLTGDAALDIPEFEVAEEEEEEDPNPGISDRERI